MFRINFFTTKNKKFLNEFIGSTLVIVLNQATQLILIDFHNIWIPKDIVFYTQDVYLSKECLKKIFTVKN